LRRIGKELTEETKKDLKVCDIKVLLKWKVRKEPNWKYTFAADTIL